MDMKSHLRRQSLVADLRRGLAELTGIPPNRLIVCDVYENPIYELMRDKKPISNIRQNDVLTAYEVDPYTNGCMHVVVTHSLLVIDQDGEEQGPLFGFPFTTSLDAEAICEQVWEHIWKIVDHMASQEGRSEGFMDAHGKHRREGVLKVWIINNQGQPIEVFPSWGENSTSILPVDGLDLPFGAGTLKIKTGSCNHLINDLKWKKECHVIFYQHGRTATNDTGLLVLAHSHKQVSPTVQVVYGLSEKEEEALGKFALRHW